VAFGAVGVGEAVTANIVGTAHAPVGTRLVCVTVGSDAEAVDAEEIGAEGGGALGVVKAFSASSFGAANQALGARKSGLTSLLALTLGANEVVLPILGSTLVIFINIDTKSACVRLNGLIACQLAKQVVVGAIHCGQAVALNAGTLRRAKPPFPVKF